LRLFKDVSNKRERFPVWLEPLTEEDSKERQAQD
jgi:hypothetical protein